MRWLASSGMPKYISTISFIYYIHVVRVLPRKARYVIGERFVGVSFLGASIITMDFTISHSLSFFFFFLSLSLSNSCGAQRYLIYCFCITEGTEKKKEK